MPGASSSFFEGVPPEALKSIWNASRGGGTRRRSRHRGGRDAARYLHRTVRDRRRLRDGSSRSRAPRGAGAPECHPRRNVPVQGPADESEPFAPSTTSRCWSRRLAAPISSR